MSWHHGLLATPEGVTYATVMGPHPTDGSAVVGWALSWLCPWGCTHVLSYEPELNDAIELACARMSVLDLPPETSLIVVSPVSKYHHEDLTAKAQLAADGFRGSAH
jgi:hypothetical protein